MKLETVTPYGQLSIPEVCLGYMVHFQGKESVFPTYKAYKQAKGTA
jgi:hypothetical protein